MKEIRLGRFGIGAMVVEDSPLDLDQEVIDGIESSRREGESFEKATQRLLAAGMQVDTYRLAGADIIAKEEGGEEKIIFPAIKGGRVETDIEKEQIWKHRKKEL